MISIESHFICSNIHFSFWLFKQAEEKLLSKNQDKEYAPIHGVPEFTLSAAKLAFGEDSDVVKNGLVDILCIFYPFYYN